MVCCATLSEFLILTIDYPWIELCPVDNAVGVPNRYPKESDLSSGKRYPIF